MTKLTVAFCNFANMPERWSSPYNRPWWPRVGAEVQLFLFL
jgi:hypothetical protein